MITCDRLVGRLGWRIIYVCEDDVVDQP